MQPVPAILQAIAEDGFAIVPGVLSRDAALSMRYLLQKCIEKDLRQWQGNPAYVEQWMVHNLMVRGEPFLRLMENPVLHAYASALLTDTCIVYAYTSSSMPPLGSNYSRRIHVDCPRVIPGYMTNIGVTLALDDFTPMNGATEHLPRSFTRLEKPSEEEFTRDARVVYPKAGDAIFFNARTWHRGGINQTPAPRHALTLNICRSYMRQRFDLPRF